MKTTIKRAFFLVSILCLPISCTHDFDEINKNPNKGEETNEIYYLTKVIIQTAIDYQRDAYMGKPSSAGRYITMLRNAGNDSYNWGAESWDNHYYRLVTNKALFDQAEVNEKTQYIALAKILEVFNFAYITELWGDIPYSEALCSKENIIYPKYDRQEDVYPDLIRKLKEANTMLQNTSLSIDANADVLYGGDNLKWRKFANSLRLRMLLRASGKISGAYPEMQEIVNNPSQYPIFSSNDDDAEIPYVITHKFPGGPTGGGGQLSDEYAEFIKRRPSKEIIDFFNVHKDPRLSIIFDPVDDPENGTVDKNEYVGVPIALRAVYDYNGGGNNISTLKKDIFYQDMNDQVRASMMTYAEVCFILAELLQKDKITMNGETAKLMYEKGIISSMNYWGVEDSQIIHDYLLQANVAYDGTLKQIIGQKWAALFLKGCEGWFDYRRTNDILGFNQGLITEGLSQDFIPYRYIYPDGERAQNKEQYDLALKIFGDDNINTKMWLIK
jgi:hypothetical protein